MEMPVHRFSDLFAQLGLPDDDAAIDDFLQRHSPLPAAVALADAPFWTPAQARLLRDEVQEDADWAVLVDLLDVALRAPPMY